MDWRTYDPEEPPHGVAVTAFGFALMIVALVIVCLVGALTIGADIWALFTDPTD